MTGEPPGDFLARRRVAVVASLSILAAVRVFLFAAAFPLFNNVDEKTHFDVVYAYARGRLPAQCAGPYEPGSRGPISTYGSPEYLFTPSDYPGGVFPPPLWSLPQVDRDAAVR